MFPQDSDQHDPHDHSHPIPEILTIITRLLLILMMMMMIKIIVLVVAAAVVIRLIIIITTVIAQMILMTITITVEIEMMITMMVMQLIITIFITIIIKEKDHDNVSNDTDRRNSSLYNPLTALRTVSNNHTQMAINEPREQHCQATRMDSSAVHFDRN